jgi:subtilisin family serine protease
MRSSLSLLTLVASLGLSAASDSGVIDKTFIVKLSQNGSISQFSTRSLERHDLFHKRAAESSLSYTVRHTYNSPGTYVGLSLEVHSDATSDDIQAQLQAITGVASVAPVYKISAPNPNLGNSSVTASPSVTSDNGTEIQAAPTPGPDANLASALEMGGVDKLHALGIKGKGIKIGIIDTGVDYRNPALGGGFGPGFKIVGGYSYFVDNGTRVNSTDPLTTCYGGGHGTHVAGE